MFLRSERQFQTLCAVCAMERKIRGGGGAGYVCAKEIIQGMEFVNQRLKISRINYFDRCWGGGGVVV